MPDKLVVDCENAQEEVVPLSQEEQSRLLSDSSESANNRLLTETIQNDIKIGLDQLAQIPNVRAKLRAVVNGTDTLTVAQLQKLVAALGLAALRERRDV